MKNKKATVKKVFYIILLVVLGTMLVGSLVFGIFGAYFPSISESIVDWYLKVFKKDISLLKTSVILLLISSSLLILTLSFKDFKKKYIG